MSYPHQPPPPKHAASSYSSASTDPFNSNPSVQQLPYADNPHNPYAQGGPNPGAGGAGVAPPGQAGQYAPYYDNEPEMDRRYEGGGMGRETWASESGWSQNGQCRVIDRCSMLKSFRRRRQVRIIRLPTSRRRILAVSSIDSYFYGGQS